MVHLAITTTNADLSSTGYCSSRLISQIPEYTCSISHNAPFRTEMCTFLFWIEHCGIWNRCILGFVNWVNYQRYMFQVILMVSVPKLVGNYWFRWWLVTCSVLSHYLNQRWYWHGQDENFNFSEIWIESTWNFFLHEISLKMLCAEFQPFYPVASDS